MSDDREVVLQPEKEKGLCILQSEEKEGIKDDSAAYSSLRRVKRAVKSHCKASGDGVRPSTPTYMCSGSFLMWFFLHFQLHRRSAECVSTSFQQLYPRLVHEKSSDTVSPREDCLSAQCEDV